MAKYDLNNLYTKPTGVESLYERMGGEEPLEKVVDGVYKLMRADPEIGKQFARFRLERLKDRTVDYLRGEFGGPAYKGSDLWISHSHLGVNNHWYDLMMKYYDQMLKKTKIDKQVAAEVYEAVERMRLPIVDPGQKFKAMYIAKAEKEAQQAQKENDERERKRKEKEQERAERMAELRRKRQEGEEAAAAGKAGGAAAPPASGASTATSTQEMEPASPRRPPSKPRAKAAQAQFCFDPAEDAPPQPIPSSLPSGAEQIFRLQCPPIGARPVVSA